MCTNSMNSELGFDFHIQARVSLIDLEGKIHADHGFGTR